MNIPTGLRYTDDHEWIKVEGAVGTIGITDYAQGELGDIVFLTLPDVGAIIKQGDPFGSIEAVKAASDMLAPVSGEVVEVNGALEHQPELINQSAYEGGWVIKVKISDAGEVAKLLDAEAYAKFVEQSKGSH